jgi:hypothetical protein
VLSGPALAAPFDALSLLLRIGSVGVAISSLESLVHRGDLGPGGMLDGETQLTRTRWLLPLSFLSSPGMAVALFAARLAAACTVILGAENFEVARAGAAVIAVSTLLLRFRTPVGIHASGSIVMVTFTAAALGLGVGTRLSLTFAAGFIAAQACLAYFVAGASKLRESSWRSGQALPLIFATLMWGNRPQAVLLNSRRRLALALSWMTMLGECAVPLALVVPLPVAIAILGCAAFFHVLTAIEMGLNSFVWAFGSTYPAIIFCWYWLHGG